MAYGRERGRGVQGEGGKEGDCLTGKDFQNKWHGEGTTHNIHMDIKTTRLNLPFGQFSEKGIDSLWIKQDFNLTEN